MLKLVYINLHHRATLLKHVEKGRHVLSSAQRIYVQVNNVDVHIYVQVNNRDVQIYV